MVGRKAEAGYDLPSFQVEFSEKFLALLGQPLARREGDPPLADILLCEPPTLGDDLVGSQCSSRAVSLTKLFFPNLTDLFLFAECFCQAIFWRQPLPVVVAERSFSLGLDRHEGFELR